MAHLKCVKHKKRVVVFDHGNKKMTVHRVDSSVCPGNPTVFIGSQGLSASVIDNVRILRSVKDGK